MRRMIILLLGVSLFSCNGKENVTKVDYSFIPFHFGKIYLERIPVNDEPVEVIDSAEITIHTEHLSFTIPQREESVFRLRMNGKPFRIYFVNDVEHIIIQGSPAGPQEYSFRNGGVNPYLKDFIDKQNSIIKDITPLVERTRQGIAGAALERLTKQADSLKAIYQDNARQFSDTTKSAGAFLFAYNLVDFGKERKALKESITNAGKRFPGHTAIQKLKQETLDYLTIYEEELNTGDILPVLYLPDSNGSSLPVLMSDTKYTFIDIWSTWCGPCMDYIPVKKVTAQKFGDKLSLVSIAVDGERENWKTIIHQQQLPGSHFIDERMWRGKAAKTWKFDSIPFNYLVSPGGTILAKAIKPDSLMIVLNKFVK